MAFAQKEKRDNEVTVMPSCRSVKQVRLHNVDNNTPKQLFPPSPPALFTGETR